MTSLGYFLILFFKVRPEVKIKVVLFKGNVSFWNFDCVMWLSRVSDTDWEGGGGGGGYKGREGNYLRYERVVYVLSVDSHLLQFAANTRLMFDDNG